jgi:hypothetical protein
VNAWQDLTLDQRKTIIEQRLKAISAVALARYHGTLIPQPCEVCGATKVHAHHDDYSRPLDVRWLCPLRHRHQHLGPRPRSADWRRYSPRPKKKRGWKPWL